MAKFISVDIESSGLDHNKCSILSFGAVIEDTSKSTPVDELPSFYTRIYNEEVYWEPYAHQLNEELCGEITVEDPTTENFMILFTDWLYSHFDVNEKINVAGKNYSGFDKRFLEKLEGWNTIKFSHRVIDPSILYMDWDNDTELPNLDECLKRANINKTVSHNALDDAMDIVNLLRVYRGSR